MSAEAILSRIRLFAGSRPLRLLVLSITLAGCRIASDPDVPLGDFTVLAPVFIPANSAHTVFQNGAQAASASRLEPYCELEIDTVAERPQEVSAGRYRIRAVRYALLADPTTRVPALFGPRNCSDPVFQESLWFLLRNGQAGSPRSLRCIRPNYLCRFSPPLDLQQAALVLGPGFAIAPGPGLR